MSWLGNLGGVERIPHSSEEAQGHDPAKVETRIALERLARRIEGLERLLSGLVQPPGGDDIDITTVTVEGTGPLAVPVPFILEPSTDITYGGVDFFPSRAYTIFAAEMGCDPYDTPTAATTFTIQNAATSPTSSGTITFATGAARAFTSSLTISIGASQRVYIVTPANLNGMQNLFRILIHYAPAGALGFT